MLSAAPDPTVVPASFRQVAYVVRDLDAAVRAWTERLGIGPWTAFTLRPPRLRDCTLRGQAAEFGLRHALAWVGEVQFELVEPLEGPSIFAEHLEQHGEGMHHVGAYVDGGVGEHEVAVREYLNRGLTPLQSAWGFGAEGDGAFAYFAGDNQAIVELISAPRVRIEPDFVHEAQ